MATMTTPLHHARRTLALAAITGGVLAAHASASVVTWPYEIETDGDDVTWTSPSATDAGAALYRATSLIQGVFVTVSVLGFPVEVEVTDEVPAEALSNAGSAPGPAPTVIFDEAVVYPDPPEPPTIAANLTVGIDAGGFGTLSATDVVLGTAETPFGTLPIISIRVNGQVTVNDRAADVNGDGAVGFGDVLQVLTDWGPCAVPVPDCSSDVNADGFVDFADLLSVLTDWG